jgi:hypothetical protein
MFDIRRRRALKGSVAAQRARCSNVVERVLNGSWTHSVHQLSLSTAEASEQAAWASAKVSVLKACVQCC